MNCGDMAEMAMVSHEGKEYWLMDLESGDRHMGAISEFPCEMEFKLIKESND